jgi:hypothetical protein
MTHLFGLFDCSGHCWISQDAGQVSCNPEAAETAGGLGSAADFGKSGSFQFGVIWM